MITSECRLHGFPFAIALRWFRDREVPLEIVYNANAYALGRRVPESVAICGVSCNPENRRTCPETPR